MQILQQLGTLVEAGSSSKVVLWSRKQTRLLIVPLASLLLLLVASAQSASANGNQLWNPGFESGSLTSGFPSWNNQWVKFGYPRSVVGVQNCCNHMSVGGWSGYIVPNGRYVELQQNPTVCQTGCTVVAGNQYYLEAWVYTSAGMTATIGWWTNSPTVPGSHTCGTTSSSTYQKIFCYFTVPGDATQFNVHLGASAASGVAVVDDWQLTRVLDGGGNDFVILQLATDQFWQAHGADYKTSILVNAIPTGYTCSGGGYGCSSATDWLALYTPRFFQIGFLAQQDGVEWFVETVDNGNGHLTVTCLQGTSGWGGQGCEGGWGSRVGLGTYQDFELVTYNQGFWVLREYDQYGQPLDVATINDTSLTINGAQVAAEEAWNGQEDQFVNMQYYNKHPLHFVSNVGFIDWEPSGSTGQKNYIWVSPGNYIICPSPYGATKDINNDSHWWYSGTGGWLCTQNPLF